MRNKPTDYIPIELLPGDTPEPAVTSCDVADLTESFYLLFSDVRPLGQRDLAYFHGLLEDFGYQLDLGEELKRFQAWSLDKGDGTVKHPRSRFRDWLRRALDYRRHYATSGR
jgi:hypothetical protein